ncbi:LacI family DNA-binding transcriptional regulator [Devosia nitrariae]|uniref:LacI family DNA-binding transcriptional regulator n=1 Tax=Devosia nitrariae TaxID=2071872 RepID=UPI0024E10FE4|nr:LacI family DNA-binding transcriptional regulator [Devosia nitrariae]
MARSAVKLADVAKAAGVSQGTASNVFSRPEVVREEVRERVMATARELGYTGPDPKGRLLRAGKVNAIGVATAEPLSYFFEDPFARVVMSGITEICDAHGAGISLVSAMNDEKLAWNIQSALVDGFILFCIEGGPRLVDLTRERQLPFVALELGINDPTISGIGVDNLAGAKQAARHLAELGHQRYGVLAMPFFDNRSGPIPFSEVPTAIYSDSRSRVAGYFLVLQEFGIDVDAIPIYETEGEEETARQGIDYLMSLDAPPTAIFCMSDRIAIAAIERLQERGLRVPQDVSVMGFDGVPEGAFCKPPLTTMAQPIAEIGRQAVKAILEDDGEVKRVTLPVELIVRESTAPPPR